MSLHSTMTMSERKLQAAAICREVLGAREMDLGRKMNTPKDIMLEELSLCSNRGSRLFRKRQIRSEKYTFEKANNEANEQTNNGAVPSAEATAENGDCPDGDQQPGTPPNTPDAKTLDPESLAPGYGGPLQDVPPEKFNSTAVPRSYHSPWDQALVNDPSLAEVLSPKTPSPEPKPEVPEYKSFNRVATPFGAYEPPQLSVLKTLELDPPPSDSPAPAEAQETTATRPTFNRTALGWVGDGAPLVLPVIDLEGVALPESDDL
ncbi:myozenin-2-like [Conger conger]|uniref:myozenin-2-like n=1 Tax=Conger conger TaxID=82655 RepID=UPI002A5A97A0|nr:myozenin-2-like [Conger conger]XP_061109035.1 myozenin-2-like [Conger conger]